jgi:hypothetical protein
MKKINNLKNAIIATVFATSACILLSPIAKAASIKVTLENLSPTNGTFLTPLWVGFHNGNFDIYNRNASAASFLERIAEDGNTSPISQAFLTSGAGTVDGTIVGPNIPPIAPGETTSAIFDLNPTLPESRYFSYATMIIPSNDAFIANGNPFEHKIFDDTGNFLGADFLVLGSEILDAGTEVNDEASNSTAFLGQTTPNTGIDEGGTIQIHPGFISGGRILSTPNFANADFKIAGYQVARIKVEQIQVPEPSTVLGLLPFLGGLLLRRSRTRYISI